MSADKIAELIREIEELQAQEPPGPRGDDAPPSPDVGSDVWFTKILLEDFQPTIGGKLPDSIRLAIDTAYIKEKSLTKAGFPMLAEKWGQIGWRITEVAIDQFGFDEVMLGDMPTALLPLAITAADLREAIKDNPNFQD